MAEERNEYICISGPLPNRYWYNVYTRGTSLSDCQICMHLALGPNRPQRFKPTAMHITLGRENCRLVCKLGTTFPPPPLHSSPCTRMSVEFRAYSSWSTKLASFFPPTVFNPILNSQIIFEMIINHFLFIATCFSTRIQNWKYLKFTPRTFTCT